MQPVTTPALPQTPAGTSPRRRVTDVLAAFDASAVDVCTAGRMAAFHFATRQGRVVIRLPIEELITKLRGERDSNGTPFASLSRVDVLAADAEALPDRLARPRRTQAESAEVNGRIWAVLVANPMQNVAELCAAHDVTTGAFHSWLNKNHPGGVAGLRGTHVRVMPTKGMAEAAERGLPITKPSAKSL